jgi:hypothetical protein
MKIRSPSLAGMLAASAVGIAGAGTLLTAPFPVESVTQGTASCPVSNVGTNEAPVTVTLGDVDSTWWPRVFPSSSRPSADSTTGEIRGGYAYVNGATIVVIPATR